MIVFYGRGTLDVKGGAATLAAAVVRLRQEGFVPDRDLVLALTADEEGGTDNVLANHRDLFDVDYCINVDAGGPEWRNGKVVAIDVQAAEKVFASFTLTAKNPGAK
jgi:acetylornithine deacetylase/succinyl-diaminopimelate desuccinylase-like protein